MKRSLDHFIIGVRDLDEAGGRFERMGFFLSPRMHHSIGTSNHLIMFGNTFLELVGGFERIDTSRGFSRVSNMGRLVSEREGVVGTSFLSNDAAVDHAALQAAGVQTGAVETFTRPVPLPDGTKGEVLCSVVMSDYKAPRLNFFVSHQHRPQYVWIPQWQKQPNGVLDIVSAAYAMRAPQEHARFFSAFTGSEAEGLPGGNLSFETGRGERLDVPSPNSVRTKYPDAEPSLSLATDGVIAIRLKVAALPDLRDHLGRNKISFSETGGVLRVPAREACGVILDFVESTAQRR